MFCDFGRRLLFIHNPKGCGHSVREHLARHADRFLNLWGVHEAYADVAPFGDLAHVPMAMADRFVRPDVLANMYSFSVVREPFGRLYSAWLWLVDQGLLACGLDELVCGLADCPHPHVLPQSYFLCDADGRVLVDQVVRQETFGTEFANLMGRFGLPPCTGRSAATRPPADLMAAFSAGAVLKVRAYYDQDFETFGY